MLHELWGEVDVDWGGETGGEVELVEVGLELVLVFFEGVENGVLDVLVQLGDLLLDLEDLLLVG